MTAKHTPGPWFIGDSIGAHCGIYNQTPVGARVQWIDFAQVVVRVEDEPSLEGEANARLIAASPRLLAAGQRLCAVSEACAMAREPDEITEQFQNMQEAWDEMRAAIAEATGEPHDPAG